MKSYAPVTVRVGVALVFIWFGFEQVTNVSQWIGWLPGYTQSWPISASTLIYLNGIFEVTFGLLLLGGLYTRLVASILALHMVHIISIVGYGEILIRDFGIFMATLSVAFHGPSNFSLDFFFSKRDKNNDNQKKSR